MLRSTSGNASGGLTEFACKALPQIYLRNRSFLKEANLPASAVSKVRLLRGCLTFFLSASGKASAWSRAFASRPVRKLAQSQAGKVLLCLIPHTFILVVALDSTRLSRQCNADSFCRFCPISLMFVVMLKSPSSLGNMPEVNTNSFILRATLERPSSFPEAWPASSSKKVRA